MQEVHERGFQKILSRIAIDLHEWRFYGSADSGHVITTYPDLGTNRAFCFATLCIVASRTRFTLDVLPMDANGFRAKREAVRSPLETAREYVSIRHVYFDRGFYRVHVVAELEPLGVDYIVRIRPSSGMKDHFSAGAETVVGAYTMQRKRKPTASVDVTVFAVPHRANDDEHVWVVTSLNVDASRLTRVTRRSDVRGVGLPTTTTATVRISSVKIVATRTTPTTTRQRISACSISGVGKMQTTEAHP